MTGSASAAEARATAAPGATAANRRRCFSATSNDRGNGERTVQGSRVTGWAKVNSLACKASRSISGFSSSRPLYPRLRP